VRLAIREHRRGEVDLPLLYTAVLLMAGVLAGAWLLMGFPVPPCMLKELTGIPCPTCGATRMARSLLDLRPLQAFAWNPLLFLGIAAIFLSGLVCGIRRLLGRPRLRVVVDSPRERAVLRIGAIVAILAGWIYLFLRGV
jgi:hypothetical protein